MILLLDFLFINHNLYHFSKLRIQQVLERCELIKEVNTVPEAIPVWPAVRYISGTSLPFQVYRYTYKILYIYIHTYIYIYIFAEFKSYVFKYI